MTLFYTKWHRLQMQECLTFENNFTKLNNCPQILKIFSE